VLIVGISAFYHESACCLLDDGVLVAAAAEERFSRLKHDASLPVEAFRFCLRAAGADLPDVDAVAYYERPLDKLSRQLWARASGRRGGATSGPPRRDPTWSDLPWLDPAAPERAVRRRLGWDGPWLTFPHHLSHAASAYYFSGFADAAVLTADGVGEWATSSFARGTGDDLEIFATVDFPHSLGLLYATLTAYLGFAVNSGEYKVMGLAPYGTPRHADALRRLFRKRPGEGGEVGAGEGGPGFELDLAFFDFLAGERMYSPALCDLLGAPPRRPGDPIEPFHQDVAASLQTVLEEVLLEQVRWLGAEVGSENLCLAGGVALNCVANGRLRRDGPFRRLFVQPAAGDAGGCLGAAALAHRRLAGARPRTGAPGRGLSSVALGPAWTGDEIADLLAASSLAPAGAAAAAVEDFRGRAEDLLEAVAERLAGGQVVGWFQGAMEHGPRALGQRSILADPRRPEMRQRLNARVKRRESFRPFAPAVLAAAAGEHFDLAGAGSETARFMLETCRVVSPLDLPAVTHVDGSARPQCVDPAVQPRFAGLLAAFARRTGCPVLLNTSFNVAGEPIVASPADALLTFAAAGLDALVLEDFVIGREALPDGVADLVTVWRADRRRPWGDVRPDTPTDQLYTFV
jgi:carbamoyltransferase